MFKIKPKQKFQLFKQNPKFCIAPWSLIYLYPDGSVKTCVAGTEVMGNLNHDSIDDIINNHLRQQTKKDILDQQLAKNCSLCVQKENQGNHQGPYQFIRNQYNELCQDLDVNYLDPTEFVLGAVDLHWSSICNLKCVTCWARQSSSIAKEQGVPVLHLPQDKASSFIDWVVKNQSTLREIYLSGGEPMFIDYNRKLLSQIHKRDNLRIRVNSNLMWQKKNQVLEEVLKFSNVLFTCSADDIGQRFNYIRRDGDWEVFTENLRFLQQQPNVKIRINLVFFVLSAPNFIDTIDHFHDQFGIVDITINQCSTSQSHLRCRNLPQEVKHKCEQKIINAIERYSSNLNLVGQLRNCLTELKQDQDQSYTAYFDHIDKLANSSWKSIFRELS